MIVLFHRIINGREGEATNIILYIQNRGLLIKTNIE